MPPSPTEVTLLVVGILICLLLGAGLVVLLLVRRDAQLAAGSVADAHERGFQEGAAAARAEKWAPVVQELAEERGRAERYFGCVRTIEVEREQWRAAYDSARLGHARAQELMLSECSALERRLQRIGALCERLKGADGPEGRQAIADIAALAAARMSPFLRQIHQDYTVEHDSEAGHTQRIEQARAPLDLSPDEQAELASPSSPS